MSTIQTASAARSAPVYFLDRSATSSSPMRLPFLNRRARKAPPPLDEDVPPPPPPKDDEYSLRSPRSSASARTVSNPHRPTRSADSDLTNYLADFFPKPPAGRAHAHTYQPVPQRAQTLSSAASAALSIPSPPPTPPTRDTQPLPGASAIVQSASSPPERPRPRPSASTVARSKSLPRISPEERARRRAEERQRQEEEERALMRLEQERQERIKAEKAAQLLEDERADAERRRALHTQLRIAAFQRTLRERAEAEKEVLRKQAIAERKRQAQLKRREEAAQLERWRAELRAGEEAVARRAAEERAALEAERARRARHAGDWAGYLGVQTEGSMHWRRRYVQLRGRHLSLYAAKPTDGDLGKPVAIVPVTKAERVLEGPDAPEELEYIAHALALELHAVGDEQGTLLMYADNAEEKESLLVALRTRTDL